MDFAYPLSKTQLHSRYDKLFSSILLGQSVTIMGLPLSSRSAFLKFIVEYDRQFLSEFINPASYHFIFISSVPNSSLPILKTIATSMANLSWFSQKTQASLNLSLSYDDVFLVCLTIENALKEILSDKHLVLCIQDADQLLYQNPELSSLIFRLTQINHQPPNCPLSLIFTVSPVLTDRIPHSAFNPIRPFFAENIMEFPLFTSTELEYTRHRLAYFRHQPISDSVHHQASLLSGGHYLLYKQLSLFSLPELKKISQTKFHPSLSPILTTIWSGLPEKTKRSGIFPSPLLPPRLGSTVSNSSPLHLTPGEQVIFDYLKSLTGQTVSRDDLALVIWGKNWPTKYSDWAMDKSISLLRQKIHPAGFNLIAIRNRGYQLCPT